MRKLLLVAMILSASYNPSGAAVLPTLRGNGPIIVEGIILDISPVLGPGHLKESGLISRYRLVRYRVERVCKGKYKGGEIVIDHFIASGDELKDRKVGDRVYALAWRSKGGTIYAYKGIRDSTEGLKYVYRGGDVLPAASPSCSFDEREFISLR
jgi:hypothetical protein